MQRGAILHLIMIITFLFSVMLVKHANFWKPVTPNGVTLCVCAHTNMSAFSVQTCQRRVLHTALHFCQILTMQTFHFHLWFSAPPSLCARSTVAVKLTQRVCFQCLQLLSRVGREPPLGLTWQTANNNQLAEKSKDSLWGFLDLCKR